MTTSAEFETLDAVETGVETVGGVERALRTDLADAVRSELTGAGLPVGDESDAGFAGAEVEVDLGDDASGGVFVTWRAGTLHVEAANRSLIDGGFDDAATRRTDVIATTMRDAMITILRAAAFDASPSDDDMRPLALRVRTRTGTSG
jgi:hypothetical protein